MDAEQAARALAEIVRKVACSPHSELRHTTRYLLRQALRQFDEARKRKTGFERVLDDDGDDLPGAEVATASARPRCKFCEREFRPRKGQKYCSTVCRKKGYYRRQARIRHKDKKPVVGSASCLLDDL